MAKLNAIELAQADRRLKTSAGWAAAHPDRAIEEELLRRGNARAVVEFGREVLGTPQTRHKASLTQQGSLARMYTAGHLSAEQLAWSAEIVQVHTRIVAGAVVGSMSMETRVDQSKHGGAFFERLGAVRAEMAYSRWRRSLPKPMPVLAMVIEDTGVTAAAKRYGMRTASARRILLIALDQWPDFFSQACDAVDEDDLARIHARLAA